MCSFGIRENTMAAEEKQIGKYAAVAIAAKDGYFSDPFNLPVRINIDEKFIDSHIMPKYVSDYYAFSEWVIAADALIPAIPESPSNEWKDYIETYVEMGHIFSLTAYSDISESTHFRLGDRRIAQGRYAENASECNISAELAELNGLSVGDSVKLNSIYYDDPNFTFEIVGIYEDDTEDMTDELELIAPKRSSEKDVIEINGTLTEVTQVTQLTPKHISRNQILTAVSASSDLAKFTYAGADLGYDILVYYIVDEKSIFACVDELSEILPDQFEIFDSGDTLRALLAIFEITKNSFNTFLTIAGLMGIVLGALIIFYVLKDRAYDISVFRLRGLSRTRTAFLMTGEVFVISLISLTAAWILYVTTFTRLFKPLFEIRGNIYANGDMIDYHKTMDAVRNYEIFLSASPLEFFVSLLVTVIFTAIIGLAAALFISRHEPMKAMTEH
jgi:ABC-type antimicrobial peptide transport system permease subunit